MLRNRVYQNRHQCRREIMAHPRKDPKTGAWNIFCGVPARRNGNKRVVGTMNYQGRSADAAQHFHPAAAGGDGKYVMDEPGGMVGPSVGAFDLGAEFRIRNGIARAADRAERFHAPPDGVLVAEKPGKGQQQRQQRMLAAALQVHVAARRHD